MASSDMIIFLGKSILLETCFGLLLCFTSAVPDTKCNQPLGMQNGDILNTSLISGPTFNNDTANYGAQLARLHSPQGYRGDIKAPKTSWISIGLGHGVIVTGIAVQGYGNATVKEWVTQFSLLYSKNGSAFKPVRDLKSKYAKFLGNKDRDSVQKMDLPFPVVASTIMFIPLQWHNNVGLRLELYGCKQDFYFTIYMLLDKRAFTMALRSSNSFEYKVAKEEVFREVNGFADQIPGFLDFVFKRFSPQESVTTSETLVAVELDIYCIESSIWYLVAKLKEEIRKSDLFEREFFKIKYPKSRECPSPDLNILPMADHDSKKLTLLKSSLPVFQAHLQHQCKSERQLLTWKTGFVDEESGILSPFMLSPVTSYNLTLGTYALKSRLIFLQCTVSITVGGETSFLQDYIFIRIINSKLFASIKAPDFAVHGGSNFSLDGSNSTASGDSEFLKNLVVKFSWFCFFKSSENSSRSCFNGSVSNPFSNEKIVYFETRKLDVGVYDFLLEFSSGSTIVRANHSVTVASYTTLSIRCTSNCLEKINPNKKQVLRAQCSGEGCGKIRAYEWMIFLFNASNSNWEALEQQLNTTSILEEGLTFTVNDFADLIGFNNVQDEFYKVKAIAYFNDFVHISYEREFVLNAVPESSNSSACSVVPMTGLAMDTYFRISCEDWKDEDLPLNFKFQYVSQFGLIMLKSGISDTFTTQLLPGSNASDFMIEITIIISDKYGASNTRSIPVRVMVPSQEEAKNRIQNVDGELDELVRKGDASKVADMSLFALSLMKAYVQDEDTETKVKDDIITHVSGMNITSVETSLKCAAILKPSTEQTKELSQQTQDNALELIEKVTNVMTEEVEELDSRNETTKITLQTAEFFGDGVIGGLSNIIDPVFVEQMSSIGPADATDRKDRPNKTDRSSEIPKRTVFMATKVAQALSSITEVGDGPRFIRTKNIALRVEKDIPNSFDKKIIKECKSTIELPPLKDVLSNVNGTVEVIGSQLLEYKNNPFDWHSSSKSIRTGIIDITLSSNGEKMNVDSLENPINLYLPNTASNSRRKEPQINFFLRPITNIIDLNSTANMNYHVIYLPSEYFVASLQVIPERGNLLEVYIRPRKRPSPLNYTGFYIIPDLSSCKDKNILTFNLSLCVEDPYRIQFTSNTTGSTGLHYIGIRTLERPSHKRSRRSRGTNWEKTLNPDWERFRTKRSENGLCIKVKDPITSPPKLIAPVYNIDTDVNYTFSTYFSSCLFWSETKEAWETRGCKLGNNSNSSYVHCVCHHMTAFGGDLFVAPNPIDFDLVLAEFSRMGESGNYVVLTTVLLLWAAYFSGLIFARRADMLDKMKVINCSINGFDKQIGPRKTYKISIQTGLRPGAGTTASVALILHGIEGSLPVYLNNDDPEKLLFARGSVNTYWITTSENIGELFKIKIWHNNTGTSPSWFLSDIVVEEETCSKRWHFLINKWLAADKEGIITDVVKTDNDEGMKLKNRFLSRAARQYSNSHLWLSLFTKSVHSTFTRCQRLSCCFLVLTSTMVTNAMFYQFSSETTESFMIGPFKVSLRSIKTGIQAALITLPINVAVAFIFEKVKSKQRAIEGELVIFEENPQGFIPRFFYPMAWFLCVTGSVLSSIFTVFYSLMWGATVSNQWLTSTMISFIQDVIVNQPIKIFLLVSLLSMIIKKPVDSRQDVGASVKRDILDSYKIDTPSTTVLSKARDILIATSTAKTFVVEIAFYMLFMILVFVVCYGNVSNERFRQTTSIQTIYKDFDQVTDSASFWLWLEKDTIPFLFNNTWYNGMMFEGPEGFLSNREMFLIGMPRLRQLRVKSDNSCLSETPRQLQHFFTSCLQEYNILTEDKTQYSLPGWQRPPIDLDVNSSEELIDNYCPKPWRYSSFKSIQTLPYMGDNVLYGGGGFVADLGYSITTALSVASNLKENNWTDDSTAAVFVEFTVFSPTTMLFSSVKLLFERFPYGATTTSLRINTFNVYPTTNKTFLQLCQFFLMIMIIITIGMEIAQLRIQRFQYFKDIWNIVQWIQLGTVVASIVMAYFKESYTSNFLTRVNENPFQTSSTDYIVLWSDLETLLLSFVIFIMTIKLLRIVRFNNYVLKLYTSMQGTKKMLGPLCALFVVVVTALSLMAYVLFGHYLYSFSTFSRTVLKLVHQLAGGKLFQRATHISNTTIGIIFGLLYASTTSLILVNVFLSTIMDSWVDKKDKDIPKRGVHPMEIIQSWMKKPFKMRKKRARRRNNCRKYAVLEINSNKKLNVHRLDGKAKYVVLYEQNNYL